MEGSNLVTLLFVVAAVFVFLQLRSVLGKRTGHERPPMDRYSRTSESPADKGGDGTADPDNVITLPGRSESKAEAYREIDKVAEPGTDVNKGLRAIRDASPEFDPKAFLAGAKMAYEMIVMSFADGDRKTLKNLLSKEVYDGFSAALDERETKGDTVRSSFVGIDDAQIVAADLREREAHITLRIVSQMISATTNKAGEVIDGDPEAVVEVKDIWTFARDTQSRDPNWRLVATESEE
ncbi:Tim44/TimA family putative adaptor protein [Oricola cellulosilytica]|uniref:Tim44/TimA family putative adaptor protein n=1 Tax=Oricola cellulosilytica TaxID=1429082 RepID=A0A4R0PGF3_9HYPH|nr:Tim44/TimA family putative adaptor protein [Oricola cellulosilytica]TCD15993.1 Tim44/TimA family putative adaptor protein [Oricola cellulosilytica]